MARNPNRPTAAQVETRRAVNEAERAQEPQNTRGPDLEKRSPDIASMIPYWDLTDAILDGIEAIKIASTDFLPRFPGELPADYTFRLSVAKLTNIFLDTVEALSSKPFEQEVQLVEGENKDVPEIIKDFIEDVDGSGNNLTGFAAEWFFNGVAAALDWVLVDYPALEPGQIRTVADQKKANIRPFWTRIIARNVLEVKSKVVNGSEVLTYFRYLEPGDKRQVRIFEREGNNVKWSLHEKEKDSWIEIDGGVVTIGVIPIVRFATGRRNGKTFKFSPPLQSAATLQRTLFQQESNLEHAKVMTAFPMLSANGVRPKLDAAGNPLPMRVGPQAVLYAPPDGAGNVGSYSYVEPGAQSLTFLSNDIDKTKQDLRELGKQPLTAQSGNLTVITTAVAAGKAKSAVGAWGLIMKNALENALVLTCLWLNIKDAEYSPEVSIYDEYDDFSDSANDLTALAAARAGGDLSQETYWSELKRRRVLSAEFDADKEHERLLAEIPSDGDMNPPTEENEPVTVPGNAPKNPALLPDGTGA